VDRNSEVDGDVQEFAVNTLKARARSIQQV
jgi:hypothetical protein